RHTISYGDWSSDVCSSDLLTADQFIETARLPGGCSTLVQECQLLLVENIEPFIPRDGFERAFAAEPGEIDPENAAGRAAPDNGRSEERRVGEEGECWGGGW